MTRLALEEDNEVNRCRGSTEKALVETEMVRKPLPEPGADSGLPQAVPFTQKGKEKNPHSDNIKSFDFCFEALVLRHSTKQRHGGKKNPAIYKQLKQFFPSNFFHTGL